MTAAPDATPDEQTLSQRELRNRSSEVLRDVEAGASFVITNNGRPVAHLVPLNRPRPSRRVSRPAKHKGQVPTPTVRLDVPTQEILDELRTERL